MNQENYEWEVIAMICGLLIAMFCFVKMMGV